MPVAPDLEGEVKEIRRRLQRLEDQQVASRGDYDDLFFGMQDVLEYVDEVIDAYGLNRPRRKASPPRSTMAARPGKKRKKSAWNVFVAQEMPKVLKKHPRFTPQRAMKEVSRRWRNSPKNPNRRKRR